MSKMSIKCVCVSLAVLFSVSFSFFILFRHCSLERISLVLRRKCVIRGLGTLESQITLLDPHRVTVKMARKRQVSADITSPYRMGRFRIRTKTFHKPVEVNMSQLQKGIPYSKCKN
jgi:hypothetical protein